MQKTGWTIHSFFLVLSGLKMSFTLNVITGGQSTTIFLCIGPFSAWWRQTNKQPWNPSASLLLTGEKAVFCNFREQELSFCRHLVDGSSVGSIEANRAFQCVHQLLNSLVSPRALKHWLFISKNLPHLKEERTISSTWWGSWFAGALLSIGGRKTPDEAAGWPAMHQQQYHGHEIRDILTVQYISIVSVSRRIFPKLGTGLHQQQYHGHEKIDILAASVLLIIPIKSLQSDDLHLLDCQAQTWVLWDRQTCCHVPDKNISFSIGPLM